MTNHNFPYPDTFLIVNGFRMHYHHSGTEAPFTVVMLHGSRSSAHAYRHFFPYLVAAGWRCFAPDAIGFGQSDTPDDTSLHTFDFHSDNLETFIRELDLRNVVLVGHEWGGLVAIDYAINRPDNTLALILTDSGVFLPNRSHGLHGLLHRSLLGDLLVRRLNINLGQASAPKRYENQHQDHRSNSQSPAARLGFLRMAARTNLHYNALRMRAIRNSLPHLKAPTLLVRSGGPQLFTKAESQYLQQRIPYAESHVLEGPDLLHEDRPDVAASLIVGFLRPLIAPIAQPHTPTTS